MYTLSKLPTEILYSIMDHLGTADVITMARLNSWYAYRLSTVMSERISRNVKSDGWRIHASRASITEHTQILTCACILD